MFKNVLLVFTAAIFLSGCGGGGNKNTSMPPVVVEGDTNKPITWAVNASAVRSFTGTAYPTFTKGNITPVLTAIKDVSTSLLISDVFVYPEPEAQPIRVNTYCRGASCESYFTANEATTLTLSDFAIRPGTEIQAVGVRNGVRIAQSRRRAQTEGNTGDFKAYGAWLTHSYFNVEGQKTISGELTGLSMGLASSFGNASGTRPRSGNARWTGIMIGADKGTGATKGHLFQGDAQVTADLQRLFPRVNVSFTNIRNLHNGHSHTDIYWRDIFLPGGGFKEGFNGDSIEGRFYGLNHEEVGGIFEHGRLIGAFGARR